MGEKEQAIRGGVVLLPAGIFVGDSTDKAKLSPLDLSPEGYAPHASLFLLQTNSTPSIVEIMHYRPKFGSWMYTTEGHQQAPEIEQNGTLSFVTTIDPLFCVLSFLERRRKGSKNMFQSLDDVLHSDECRNFRKMCSAAQVELICDVKEVGDESFYRISDHKVLIWLHCKIDNLMKGSKLSQNSAAAVLSQYLSHPWDDKCLERFGKKIAAEPDAGMNAAQELALSVILEDAKKENEAVDMNDHSSKEAPAAKKRKVAKKPRSGGVVTRSKRPVTSYFTKK